MNRTAPEAYELILPPSSVIPCSSPRICRCGERPASALIFYAFLVILGGGRVELPTMLVAAPFLFSYFQLFVVGVGDAHRRRGLFGGVLAGGGLTPGCCLIALRLGHLPLCVDIASGQRRIEAFVLAHP